MRLILFVLMIPWSVTSLLGMSAPDDLEQHVQLLHEQAAAQHDVWTALQLESYATHHAMRVYLPPVLSKSLIFGDPLLSFPSSLRGHWEHAGISIAIDCTACYMMTLDGCPLASPFPLPFSPHWAAVSYNNQMLLSLVIWKEPKVLSLVMQTIPDGKTVMRRDIPVNGQTTNPDRPVISADGSASALDLVMSGGPSEQQASVLIDGPTINEQRVKGFENPIAIGPDGHWFIATSSVTRSLCLWADGRVTTLETAAVGPDRAVVMSEGKLLMVQGDGSTVAMPEQAALGRDAQVVTVGSWLAIGSGSAGASGQHAALIPSVATRHSQGDAGISHQVLLYRWSELAADAQAPPARILTDQPLWRARFVSAGLYCVDEHQLSYLDLSQDDTMCEYHLAKLPSHIERVIDHMGRILIEDDQGHELVVDPRGRTCYSATNEDITLLTPDYLVRKVITVGKPAVTQLVHLDEASNSPHVVDLDLDEAIWHFQHLFNSRILVAQAGENWAVFDMQTGAVRARSSDKPRPPRPIGDSRDDAVRFGSMYAHLWDKFEDGGHLAQTLVPVDVWPLASGLGIACWDGRIFSCDMTTRHAVLLGSVFDEDCHFASQDGHVVLADPQSTIVGQVNTSTIDTAPASYGTRGTVLPEAANWQFTHHHFITPSGEKIIWNKRFGLFPSYPRVPDHEHAYLIWESMVIQLNATDAQLFGETLSAK